jgi:TatA/E family protein of Tat protein translocase
MFGSIGMPELILIFIVALLVFGPKKLPEIGKSIGKGLAEFKRASDDLKKTIEQEIEQGKNEVSSVREQVTGVEKSIRETVPAAPAAPLQAAEARPPSVSDGAPPMPAAAPPDPLRAPDPRPIEPT